MAAVLKRESVDGVLTHVKPNSLESLKTPVRRQAVPTLQVPVGTSKMVPAVLHDVDNPRGLLQVPVAPTL